MAYKNYGPSVSQTPAALPANQFSGEEKSFETLVIQADKVIVDWEINLLNEIARDHGVRLSNQRFHPSSFLSGDYLEDPAASSSYEFLSAVVGNENQFKIKRQDALVNGWHIRFEYSPDPLGGYAADENWIILNAPPAAGTRTDLVILEVWRALLKTGLPANKSAGGLICRNGNVKAPDAVNFTDDILDPNEAPDETAARVQIQYRYRVIDGVTLDTYPDGLDDPVVVANTVSDFGGPGADGSATVLTYSPVSRDPGLWVAGTGSAGDAATLGTVDGFMYAIPICAVFRRNTTTPFNRDTNLNGGDPIAAGTSDRPDGLFVDQIVTKDIRDMRKCVARDYNEILQKTTQEVFDNNLRTQHEITPGNTSGVTIFAKEDIGVGGHSGDPDRVRRFFSDRSYVETVVAMVEIPGPGAVPSVVFDLNALSVAWDPTPPDPPINLIALAPPGTNLLGVKSVRMSDPNANMGPPSDQDLLDIAVHPPPFVDSITYSATGPTIDTATIVFDIPIGGGAGPTYIFAELMIEYPSSNGLFRNVINSFQAWGPDPTTIGTLPAPWIDGTLWTAILGDPTRWSLDTSLWNVDNTHREALIHIKTTTQVQVFLADITGSNIHIWERLTGDPITINDGVNPPYPTTNYTYNTAYTTVQLSFPVAPGVPITVSYEAYRPAPDLPGAPLDSFQIFFESAAIQSIEPPAGGMPHTMRLVPRAISNFLYIIANGSGSPDDAFPFNSPGAQIPIPELPTATHPESTLDTPNFLSIVGFGINTGFMQVESKVPYVPNPSEVYLHREAVEVVEDDDGRFFWPRSHNPLGTDYYSPVVYGQLLSSNQRHKVAFPVLMELAEDFDNVGRKGTLVLVVYSKWADFSKEVNINLSDVLGDSGASVFRVRGNFMNAQRTDI